MSAAIEQFNGMGLLQVADLLSKSNLVPKQYRGKPADCAVALMWGEEVGIGAFAAVQYLDVVEGNPTVNADGCNALIRRAGHSLWFEMGPDKCVAHGKRADTGDEMTVTWTIEMAKTAGLAGKQVWKSYATDMLKSRATTQIARALFADVLMGVKYTPEEAASFAEPELLDTAPDALAQRTVAQPALQAAPDNSNVDANAGLIDTEPKTILEAGLRATEHRQRGYKPPTSAENTSRIMAEFTNADAVKALKARVDAIDAWDKDVLRDEWKAAGLPSVQGPDPKWTDDALKLADTLIGKFENANDGGAAA